MKITIMTPEIRELEAKAAAWEKRCEELEQENRELRDRIGELDWTIGQYDDENRELREKLCKCGKEPFPVSLNDWARRIHEIAVKHGWWETEEGECDDGGRPFLEIVALCHSELSEALEEYRNDKPMAYQVQSYGIVEGRVENDPAKWFPASKPEGVAVEMIDCMIRILDWCGHEGIDVDTLMEKKVMYNKKRPYRHGGKKA